MSVDGERIRFKNKNYTTLDEWKSYLGGLSTPISVIYRLKTAAEPQTITLPQIKTLDGTTILSVDTTVSPTSIEGSY